jgi:biotin carboxyl carrier protein
MAVVGAGGDVAMKRVVQCDGQDVMLEFEVSGEHCKYRFTKNGVPSVPTALSFQEAEPGIYTVLLDGRSYEVKITPGSLEGWHVDVSGRRLVIDVVDPRSGARKSGAGADGRQQVAAPMPGKVVRVLVGEGDTVEAGQGLVVVEAMKMQNEMKAPKAGKVLSLIARPGATVTAGEVLVTLE